MKDIPGFEGRYAVPIDGRVYSHPKRTCNKRGKWLSARLRAGYLSVTLSRNGRSLDQTVHRLVAVTYVSNPSGHSSVNHKNGIKTDNHATNLEWVTPAQNSQHAVQTGLIGRGGCSPTAKLTEMEVREIKSIFATGAVRRIDLARRFRVSTEALGDILKGRTWRHVQ
jgi:hypothetical protein